MPKCSRCGCHEPAPNRKVCPKCLDYQRKRDRQKRAPAEVDIDLSDLDVPPEDVEPDVPPATEDIPELPKLDRVHEHNRRLIAEVLRLQRTQLTEDIVREQILRLSTTGLPPPPSWLDIGAAPLDDLGTPVIFGSDQHLGEVVSRVEVDGLNEYNIEIARARWRRWTEKSIELAFKRLANPRFPGVVVCWGGDGVSGDIHEELSITNDLPSMPAVLELASLITWSLKEFKRAFGKVLTIGVTGNHPRNSKKPRAKQRVFTNFDWLAYQIAAREFEHDPDVTFQIPSSSDARFEVQGKRFLLTHGDQFRGGDGIIGSLGPVFRGDAKKRAMRAQVGHAYDVLMLGHFHQLRIDNRVVMNGSLKGYDEYAIENNFPFEQPKQALFFVHPRYGVTLSLPVFAEAA